MVIFLKIFSEITKLNLKKTMRVTKVSMKTENSIPVKSCSKTKVMNSNKLIPLFNIKESSRLFSQPPINVIKILFITSSMTHLKRIFCLFNKIKTACSTVRKKMFFLYGESSIKCTEIADYTYVIFKFINMMYLISISTLEIDLWTTDYFYIGDTMFIKDLGSIVTSATNNCSFLNQIQYL